MGALLMLLGGVFILVGFFCSIIILIDAFQNEVWKGIVYILIPFYALYYVFAEFQHERKGLILLGVFGGGIAGWILFMVGGVMSAGH